MRKPSLVVFLSGMLCAILWTSLIPVQAQNRLSAYQQYLEANKSASPFRFEITSAEAFDRANLTPHAHAALRLHDLRWNHAQTENFVFHYERKIFATKVARLSEFLHEHIQTELGSLSPRLSGRNHVFIFRSKAKWDEFVTQVSLEYEWAFSTADKSTMYLQRADDRVESLEVVAHEITHILLFRFFGRPPPLWLNEGLAQWYEVFGYSAYKGARKSWRNVFRKRGSVLPLERLFTLERYPDSDLEIPAYYETAKYLVGFLMTRYAPIRMQGFLTDITGGMPVLSAFKQHYGFESLSDLQREFDRFGR